MCWIRIELSSLRLQPGRRHDEVNDAPEATKRHGISKANSKKRLPTTTTTKTTKPTKTSPPKKSEHSGPD